MYRSVTRTLNLTNVSYRRNIHTIKLTSQIAKHITGKGGGVNRDEYCFSQADSKKTLSLATTP
jgi:hypothetical protein